MVCYMFTFNSFWVFKTWVYNTTVEKNYYGTRWKVLFPVKHLVCKEKWQSNRTCHHNSQNVSDVSNGQWLARLPHIFRVNKLLFTSCQSLKKKARKLKRVHFDCPTIKEAVCTYSEGIMMKSAFSVGSTGRSSLMWYVTRHSSNVKEHAMPASPRLHSGDTKCKGSGWEDAGTSKSKEAWAYVQVKAETKKWGQRWGKDASQRAL